MDETNHYDYLIIGSGFGGAVSALRLAEKGWRVAVLEQGRRIGPDEIREAKASPVSKAQWLPALRMGGFFVQHVFRHVGILGGVGVGGGSLVWGAVMLPPKPGFYSAAVWSEFGIDMQAELAPHLETARQMLGVEPNPGHGLQDDFLKKTATAMGKGESWGKTPQAIYFGERPAVDHADPYFNGSGPQRTSCRFCGGCLGGCEYGSKNSLDYNYLHLAKQQGVEIHAETQVTRIEPMPSGGYRVHSRHPWKKNTESMYTADKLILAAGVIGTLNLLLRARDEYAALPDLSPRCGEMVRTNSEALTAILNRDPNIDVQSDGAAISSDFYADEITHITQNRLPASMSIMRFMFAPMREGQGWRRVLRTVLAMFTRDALRNSFGRHWAKRITTLTVMQDDESGVGMRLRRRLLGGYKLVSTPPANGKQAPSYLPLANEATRRFAEVSNGIPLSSVQEAVAGKAMTAHILGGCPMGATAETGVIDSRHEVHGYPGLFVVDGASIPANLGVNPSLTITAMAERFAAMQPSA